MKIVVFASLTKSLTNFRKQLLAELALLADGGVVAAAPEIEPDHIDALAKVGVRFVPISMQRTSTNPIADLRTLWDMVRLIARERPDVVLAYTQKPIIYGGIATQLFSKVRFFAMQTGLGYAFSPENKSARLRRLVSLLYRVGLRKAEKVFVFNRDDEAEMRSNGILQANQAVVQVPGSGVDPNYFVASPPPPGPPIFLLVARLLRDKGLFEYAEAARILKAESLQANFQVLGPLDPNPAGVSQAQIEQWRAEGVIDYLGETHDVRPFLKQCSVFVLPSYREGLPRSTLEAMSTGRAIVTSDAPGCRETIVDDKNGFLVPIMDAQALADGMRRFIDNPALIATMGANSRRLVESTFDVARVNQRLIAAMNLDRDSISATSSEAARGVDRWRERIECTVALVALICLSPAIIVVAALLFLTMGGPVLFKQVRAGRSGARFTLIKFRTMTDERNEDGSLKTDAERTTPLGAFLRRVRLDELPELWNIARGEMAFVGPRPLLPHSPLNTGPGGMERLKVLPGLTGWAQINGNTLLTDDQKLKLDLWYVSHRTLKLDLSIVLRTLLVVVAGEKLNDANLREAGENSSPASR